jgi:hypothetical protein
LLASGDFDAGTALHDADTALRTYLGSADIDRLTAMVASFEHAHALALLRDLRRRLVPAVDRA